MIKILVHVLTVSAVWMGFSFHVPVICAAEWRIPMAGNAFRTAPDPGKSGFKGRNLIAWSDPNEVISVYFHMDRSAVVDLAFRARTLEGPSLLVIRIGEKEFRTEISDGNFSMHPLGTINVPNRGYLSVHFQGVKRTGKVFAEISDLVVSSDTEGLRFGYVENNDGNMFYWGRRGPSVHLRYQVPKDREIQFAYSEITVPIGKDPIGSYFMANGFGEGYFGFQVNGVTERRVLFSVWSPFKTDNPREIPEDQRIIALAAGPGVHLGEFGNEGSGGQSFLLYPWNAGITYRFLTEVVPDGDGNTIYTSWFGDKSEGRWRLIASFRRPKTVTYLKGFHSFLESFNPNYGYIERQALYGNVWVCDKQGHWHECIRAGFSVDATGRDRQRLDFTGGVEENYFYLRNCGFFNETGHPGETFTRGSSSNDPPDIDFAALPRNPIP